MSKSRLLAASASHVARARWVSQHIIPCEPRIRRWLAKWSIRKDDGDEIIQDAYCRLAMLDAVDHIGDPAAYFFSIVRNLASRRVRQQNVVHLETIAEIDACQDVYYDTLEREMANRQEYERLMDLIRTLPAKCRQIVELRKLEGWSQREIARHLGISEKTVEKQIWLGLKAIRAGWTRWTSADVDRALRSAKG